MSAAVSVCFAAVMVVTAICPAGHARNMGTTSLGKRRDFRDLFDQLDGVALWTATERGTFDYISTGFEDIWGIPPAEVENDVDRLLETIHPADRNAYKKTWRQSRDSPTSRMKAALCNPMGRYDGY